MPKKRSPAKPTAKNKTSPSSALTRIPASKRAGRLGPKKAAAAGQEKLRAAGSDALSIVGIGASAGGFEAFAQLLSHLPTDTGMAFVLVQHLDPTHESKLTELLARTSPIPVREVRQGMKLEPNQVYCIPHNVDLRLLNGRLRLSPRTDRGPHMPVDTFFRSLAEELKERAIGVVLSGNGSDGTLGLQAIKAGGGITFAQDEQSAKFFGMPGSAISGGCVDFVLAPEAIARELGHMARHPLLRPPVTAIDKPKPEHETEEIFRDRDQELGAIFALLRTLTGVDFAFYKHTTVKRRIVRRMVLHKLDVLSDYVSMLQSNAVEVEALFNDILISVTGFFRDPAMFQVLKKRAFPKLVKNRRSERPLRVWICGCSSGEEAYSLAMTLVEFMEDTKTHRPVQIFATDISDLALEKARAGVYSEHIRVDVSPERLRRFFIKSNGSYQVAKTIRDMCVFARQNVLADPPFSHIDLISCRNVLIYFGATLQKKVLPIFHYALKPDGLLLLGSSETVSAVSDLFSLVDRKHKLYAKKAPSSLPAALPETRAPGHHGKVLHGGPTLKTVAPKLTGSDIQEQVDQLILSRFSPAAVVIDEQMEILQFRGRTGLYLEHAAGAASLNLLKMAREGLVLELRSAISRARRTGESVRQEAIRLPHNGQSREIGIEVVPLQLSPSRETFYLVLFDETSLLAPALARPPAGKRPKTQKEEQKRAVSKLEEELEWTRQSLQGIIQEQEATNEELKSANEEIQSSNEELQSTNEELETAKEELQSTNEELTTLNEELQNRNVELSQANNDLTNLLTSVNMAIIMLGNDLTIRRFTPMAERVFNLIPSDAGRRLTDLHHSLVVPDLDRLLQQVIEDLTFVDREVRDSAGHWYSLRLRPYRTHENKIDGVVLLLVDLGEHFQTIEQVMTMVNQPLLALTPDLKVKKANARFCETFHVQPEAAEGHYVYDLGTGQWNIPQLRALLEEVLPKDQRVQQYRVEADFPELGRRTMLLNAHQFYEAGKGLPLILLSIEDVTEKG